MYTNTHKFDEGVEVKLPEYLRINTNSSKQKRGFNALATSGIVPMPFNSASVHLDNLILDALKLDDMELVQELEIEPLSSIKTSQRTLSKPAEIIVDLTQDEEAVMLLEQEGMYIWKYASQTHTSLSTRYRGGQVESTQKQKVFYLDIAETIEPEINLERRSVLDKFTEFAWSKVKAYIFKFIASVAVEMVQDRLERNVSRSLVLIKSTNPETWQTIRGLEKVNLPTDRAPKVFLFVHGTFSSTVGAFGSLGATPWGKAFLEAVLEHHDIVLGFNHATLSEDPLLNAQQLLDHLRQIHWPVPPIFNVVTHSRGGLVVRCLLEKLLPLGSWQPTFNRVVFVASTHGGTLLAEPKNWDNLVNLYTNLAAGTCRVINLIAPQSKVATLVLNDIIQSISSLIKYCAASAITDRLIPGLAAMQPEGDFIKDINRAQPGQPTNETSYYCVITSEFKPRLLGNQEPKELSKRFLGLLGGGFMHQLMNAANDLVVNTDSMSAIDIEAGNFIKERFDFGENPQVYHTNYFTRPEVANALTRWFKLLPAKLDQTNTEPLGLKRKKRGVDRDNKPNIVFPTVLPKESLPEGLILPPFVDTDIITVNAKSPVESLQANITKYAPSYVVVQRPYQNTVLHYALETEDVIRMAANQQDRSIMDAFNLHEYEASNTQTIYESIAVNNYIAGNNTASRGVILAHNIPVGVVPEKKEFPDAETLAQIAQLITNPKTVEERIAIRRTMPSFETDPNFILQQDPSLTYKENSNGVKIPENNISKDVTKVTCYFRADMDSEVVVNRTTTIVLSISRDILDPITSELSVVTSSGTIRNDKKILVRVIPRSRFIVVDASEGQAEIWIPPLNESLELSFDIRATAEEGEGELWILFRQEQVSVAKLVLKPKVVKTRSHSEEKLVADKKINAPVPLDKPLHQLWIEERKSDDEFSYRYTIYSEGLGINRKFTSKSIFGDRGEYVARLYKQIENRWLSSGRDIENFGEELRAFGADLFDELIPAELQKILWERRHDFDSMQVISCEPFIPWELVHLRDSAKRGMPDETIFMGQLGLIRWLDGAGENGWPTDQLKIRDGRVCYVIPTYPHPDYKLPEAEKEADFLKHAFRASEVKPESGEVRRLIAKPGGFDLLHFACHGIADSNSINEASLLMAGRVEGGTYVLDSFTASVATSFSNLKTDDNEPMVVLNACQAGRAGYKLTGIGGFANAFLLGGAGAFIGTLWSVGDSPARTFTETLYKALLTGKDLSEATIEARYASKQAGEATWLAYVVYGHPHLKIIR